MLNNPEVALEDALGRHQERIAAAQRRRLVAQVRRASKRRRALAAGRGWATATPLMGRGSGETDVAHWLVRVGDIVAHYPAVDLDRRCQSALGVVVNELLRAARESGVDVPSGVAVGDPVVVVLRTLGRLAALTAGQSIPVSQCRAEVLQPALGDLRDDLGGGRQAHVRLPRRGVFPSVGIRRWSIRRPRHLTD